MRRIAVNRRRAPATEVGVTCTLLFLNWQSIRIYTCTTITCGRCTCYQLCWTISWSKMSWSMVCRVVRSMPRALAMLVRSRPNCNSRSMKSISSPVNGLRIFGQDRLHWGQPQWSSRWWVHRLSWYCMWCTSWESNNNSERLSRTVDELMPLAPWRIIFFLLRLRDSVDEVDRTLFLRLPVDFLLFFCRVLPVNILRYVMRTSIQ